MFWSCITLLLGPMFVANLQSWVLIPSPRYLPRVEPVCTYVLRSLDSSLLSSRSYIITTISIYNNVNQHSLLVYRCQFRGQLHMTIRRFMLILVQTLEAAYSIVATGRKTGAIYDEFWLTLTLATTHQARTVSKTW